MAGRCAPFFWMKAFLKLHIEWVEGNIWSTVELTYQPLTNF
jgi:hypothetical protein